MNRGDAINIPYLVVESTGTPIYARARIVSKCALADNMPTNLCLISVSQCVVCVMRPELEKAFKALDVPFSATKSEIRLAYRSLVRAHHRAHGAHVTEQATERLAEINAAKDLLDRLAPGAPTRQRRNADAAQRSDATASDARSPIDERSRREADARAVRKANEARTDTELTTVRYTRTSGSALSLGQRHMRKSADVIEKEEESRRRSAAFAAALGSGSAEGRRSIFTRLTRANAR